VQLFSHFEGFLEQTVPLHVDAEGRMTGRVSDSGSIQHGIVEVAHRSGVKHIRIERTSDDIISDLASCTF
jgi:hypothetical protein